MQKSAKKMSRRKGKGKQMVVSTAPARPTITTMTMQAVPPEWDPMIVDPSPMTRPRTDQICTFRRTTNVTTITASSTGPTVLGFQFALSSLPSYTEFTTLFDQYRILEVILTFSPVATSASTSQTTTFSPGFIGTAIDLDDANLPALTDIQQYDSYQRNSCVYPFRRVIKPRAALAAYSGTFTSYANVYGQWFDAASPGVLHYGLKAVVFNAAFSAATNVYEVEATYTVQLRCQR